MIAFDLDDTLWDVRPVLINAEKQLDLFLSRECPSLKYDVTSMRSLRDQVLEEEPDLINRITEFRRHVIKKALTKSGISAADAEIHSIKAMEIFLEARNQIDFFDDVVPTLKQLYSRFTLGVLTNGNADINRLGLDQYFSFSYSAEDIGAPKPATDLFHVALKHTKSAPAEMVYVGDDLRLDVESANQAGIHSVWVNRKKHKALKPEDIDSIPSETIDNIGELPAAVEKISRRFLR